MRRLDRDARGLIGMFVTGVVGFVVGVLVDAGLGTTWQSFLIALAAALCTMTPLFIGTVLWSQRAVR